MRPPSRRARNRAVAWAMSRATMPGLGRVSAPSRPAEPIGVARSSGGEPLQVAMLDRRSIRVGEIEQVQLGHAVLRKPQRQAGAEDESVLPHGAEQELEAILRRAPDPADV